MKYRFTFEPLRHGVTYEGNAGNRTSRTPQPSGTASNYSYDNIYELTQVTQGSSTTESYSYDPVGNRLSSLGVSSYTNNTSNELTSTSNTSYTYDYNGNTLTSVTGSNTTTYAWDFENRLTSVTLPGSGGTISFAYDPFGRRIKKVSASGTSIFAYDGDNLVEETNSSGTAVARYSQGLNIDEPLAMLRSSATSYYHADGLGSITSLSNASGSIAQTYTYDSFGNLTASTGSLTNPFQYTARENDAETGLYYYRARFYDPQSGRFLSEDPVGFDAGVNFYDYVRNNPIILIDPTGLQSYDPPNKHKNTIACDGHGVLRVQLGYPETLGGPKEQKCLIDCARVHEESHIADMLAAYPKVCNGKARGVIPKFDPEPLAASEIKASNAELDCLRDKLEHGCKNEGCGPIILNRIQDVEAYRNGFQNKH